MKREKKVESNENAECERERERERRIGKYVYSFSTRVSIEAGVRRTRQTVLRILFVYL